MMDPEALQTRNEIHNMGMRHTVRVEHVSARDAYGGKTYGPVVEYQCRVDDRNRLVQGQDGSMRTSTGQVVFAYPPPVIDLNDRLQIPVPVSPTFPTGWKRIGQIIDVQQDPTGAGYVPTVVFY